MAAIYRRELKSMFTSIIGYLTIALLLIYYGFMFSVYNVMAYKLGDMQVTIGNSLVGLLLMMLCFSVITMRCFAEERKSKTDQLLLTSPIKVWDIVLGKYFAILTLFAVIVAVLLVYFFVLGFFGTIYVNESLIVLFGFFLYGAMCLAIGLFVSTLCENPIVSAVLSFFAMMLSFFMSTICTAISESGNWFTDILGTCDGLSRLLYFFEGQFNICAIAYYVSFILLMLFLAVQAIQKRRYTVSVKSFTFGAYSVASVIIAIIVAVLFNIGLTKIPTEYTYFDWSTDQVYKLTSDTEDTLDKLTENVNIIILEKDEESYDGIVTNYLKQYEKCKYITVKYVDPLINTKYYKQYTDTAPSQGAIIINKGDKSRVIEYNDLFVYNTYYDSTTYSYQKDVTGYDVEGRLTAAINYVTSDNAPKMYILTGHQEVTPGDSFLSNIDKANYEREDLNLSYVASVPEDADVILINAPQIDFSKDELEKMTEYVNRGGDLIVTMSATEEKMTNFEALLALYGVTTENAIVFDNNASYHYAGVNYEKMYLLPEVEDNNYKSAMSGRNVLLASCKPIYAYAGSLPVTQTGLLCTSSSAYTINLDNSGERADFEQTDDDKSGCFSVAMKAELTCQNDISVMYLVSSGAFLHDDYSEAVSQGNLRLFSLMIAEFNQDNITIPAKSIAKEYLTVSAAVSITMLIVMVIAIPLIILITGIVIYVKRRKR